MAPKSKSPTLSVVVPVFNEEACLPELIQRLEKVLNKLGLVHEILFVDDGSQDGSAAFIQSKKKSNPRIGLVQFTRNFGHQAALSCGIHYAKNDLVVIMDADLQDPPELIPQMVKLWEKGFEVVYAQRRKRFKEPLHVRITSALFYRLMKQISKVHVPLDTGEFRLMDRSVVEAFKQLSEKNRYVRGLVGWVGYRQVALLFDRPPRFAGQTKYPFWNRFRLALDAIYALSDFPLQLISYVGVLAFILGVGFWLSGNASIAVLGLYFLMGMQCLLIGIAGKYIGRTYQEAQNRPLYLVRQEILPKAVSSVKKIRRRAS